MNIQALKIKQEWKKKEQFCYSESEIVDEKTDF